MNYKSLFVKGLSWSFALRGLSRLLTYVRIAILARILTPAQFGIFGIATLVLTFLEIMTETWINVFLVQQSEDVDSYVSTAWVISIVRGLLITISIVVSSRLISEFFHSPDSLPVLLLISIVPFIRGFINPSI